jgi:hypothetical protein
MGAWQRSLRQQRFGGGSGSGRDGYSYGRHGDGGGQ